MFIDRCDSIALQDLWFEPQNNDPVTLRGQSQMLVDSYTVIQPTILYLDEWLDFIRTKLKLNDQQMK